MHSGQPTDGEPAMELAEAHRQYINRWFYDCGYEMHRRLAQMYVSEERFTKTYNDAADGLAQYVHDAIMANADRVASG